MLVVKAGVRVFLFCEATGEQVAVGGGAEAGSRSQREAPSQEDDARWDPLLPRNRLRRARGSGWDGKGWRCLQVAGAGPRWVRPSVCPADARRAVAKQAHQKVVSFPQFEHAVFACGGVRQALVQGRCREAFLGGNRSR